MPFGDLSLAQVTGFLLVLIRAAALIATLPFFGSPNVPEMVKAGLALSLALLISPMVKIDPALLPRDMWQLALLAAGELMIGMILGMVVRLLLTSVQIMGQLAGFQMGFSVANVFDPIGGGQVAVVAQFCYVMALLAFLGVGGHLHFFRALADSFQVVPPGGFSLSRALYEQFMGLVTQMFLLSVKIGAPVVGALLFTQVAMGVVAKTVPQMNILIVGFPVTISVGLIFLSLTLSILVPLMSRVFKDLGPVLDSFLKAM
ncbi:MAG: flagellar biosynthetic protein FliR [Pseudomonadota bacterium]